MTKQFYEKVLPKLGKKYCVAWASPTVKGMNHEWVTSVDDIVPTIEDIKAKKGNVNIYIALSSFGGNSRAAKHAQYRGCFFVDLDVGDDKAEQGKGYIDKASAEKALDEFVVKTGLPPVVKLDSGNGIHGYWPLEEDMTIEEWAPYADKFYNFCVDSGLIVDSSVMQDAARIMRAPDTYNCKSNPPKEAKLLTEVFSYNLETFKNILGEAQPSLDSILKQAKSPLSEDQKKLLKLDNFKTNFTSIAEKSLHGKGCAHIKRILETNPNDVGYDDWFSILSIAQQCDDRDTAIHLISEDHKGYSYQDTEFKANETQDKPHSCETFDKLQKGICDGCPHKGKITNPLYFGKQFKEAKPVENLPAVQSNKLVGIPKDLGPFKYGENGGIYYQPPITYDEDGQPVAKDPVLVCSYDLYPIKRIYSVVDGECLLMRAHLPNDPEREFLLPMKHLYAIERFKEALTSVGILYNPNNQQGKYIMSYIYEWGQYLIARERAEVMRMQMGWTPDKDAFVIGNKEINRKGELLNSPTSPLCRGIAKHLSQHGEYAKWKEAANKLNSPGLELHAFTMLAGFGSILMDFTPTSGVTISLVGDSGAAKTGSLYANLSIWGNAKDLSVLEATENGMTGRYLGLHNLPFGLDEVGNIHSRTLSQLVHKISQGKSKIRMQASVNAEREHEMAASLIAVFTTNHSLYDKLATLKKDPNGEVARLIELTMRKPKVFAENPNIAREIFNTFLHHYGWAGPDFVQSLFKYSEDELNEKLTRWADKFKRDFGDDTVYRFYESLISATFTAGEIAVEHDIVDLNLDSIYRAIVTEMIHIRDHVIRVNSVDYESVLGEYINAHQTGILAIETGNKITMEPRANLVIRAELDNEKIYLEKKHFRQYLTENGVSTSEFMFQMKEKGYKIQDRKLRMGTGWKPATGFSPVTAIEIDTTKFLKDLLEEQRLESNDGA